MAVKRPFFIHKFLYNMSSFGVSRNMKHLVIDEHEQSYKETFKKEKNGKQCDICFEWKKSSMARHGHLYI